MGRRERVGEVAVSADMGAGASSDGLGADGVSDLAILRHWMM